MNKNIETLKSKIIDAINEFRLETGIQLVDIVSSTTYNVFEDNSKVPVKTEISIQIIS